MANNTLMSQGSGSGVSLRSNPISDPDQTNPGLLPFHPSHFSFTSLNLQSSLKKKTWNVCTSDLAQTPHDRMVVVNSPARLACVRRSILPNKIR